MKNLFLVFLIVIVSQSLCIASSVPRVDFINYTESALNALDEVEVVFSSHDSKTYEVNDALKKLDIALKKYDRFKNWGKTPENEIFWKITYARLNYDIVIMQGLYGPRHDEAKQLGQQARDLFTQYKNKASKKRK